MENEERKAETSKSEMETMKRLNQSSIGAGFHAGQMPKKGERNAIMPFGMFGIPPERENRTSLPRIVHDEKAEAEVKRLTLSNIRLQRRVEEMESELKAFVKSGSTSGIVAENLKKKAEKYERARKQNCERQRRFQGKEVK
jgi:hypothetical protein